MKILTDSQERLKRMRRFATGLLVIMAILYFVSRSYQEAVPFWHWVRAFSEAAMVGALADWFAVTALFRHPLGLPIPHTAIVREEKERIGGLVGQFVRGSFLTQEEISRQWEDWQPVSRFVNWVSEDENGQGFVRQVAGVVPKAVAQADGEALVELLASKTKEGLENLPVGRVVSVLLQGFLRSPSRREVLGPVLGRISKTVSENREWVMDEARKSAPMRGAKVLGTVTEVAAMMMSGKAINKLSSELEAASENPEHGLYDKIEESLQETLRELQEGNGGEWESFKERVLADSETEAILQEVIQGVGRYLISESRRLEAGETGDHWGGWVAGLARRLKESPEKLAQIEAKVEQGVGLFFERYGESVEAIIRNTVNSWEADDLIERLENQVGPDLQFIRINGTIIGGCVGVLLHALGMFIWP